MFRAKAAAGAAVLAWHSWGDPTTGSAQPHVHALRGPEALACPSPPAGQTEESFEEWSWVHPALCLPWAQWALPSCVGLGTGPCADCPLLLLLGWQRKDILAELSKSQKVFSEKLDHLSRRLAWVHAAVYSQVSRAASARGCSLRRLPDWPLTGPGAAGLGHTPAPSQLLRLRPTLCHNPYLFMPVNSSRCRPWAAVPRSSSHGPPWRTSLSRLPPGLLPLLLFSQRVQGAWPPQPQSASRTPSIPCC